MVPGAIVDFSLRGFDLDGAGAHVQHQEQSSVQKLHREEVHLVVLQGLRVTSVLRFAVGEEDQPVGFGGAEVEGDGAHTLGVPLGQRQEGVGGLEIDGVQGGDVLALEDHVALEFHLWVHNAGEARQLQADIVVLVHHLGRKEKRRLHLRVNGCRPSVPP